MTSGGEVEDPYAIFKVEGKKAWTKHVTKDKSPTWNHGCWFRVEGNVKIQINFWDKDTFGDDRIGYAYHRNGFTLSEDTLKHGCTSEGVDGECKKQVAVVNEQGERTGGGRGVVTLVLKYINLQTRITDPYRLTPLPVALPTSSPTYIPTPLPMPDQPPTTGPTAAPTPGPPGCINGWQPAAGCGAGQCTVWGARAYCQVPGAGYWWCASCS